MHDGGGPRGETLAALPAVIDTLRARGYGFETVSRAARLPPHLQALRLSRPADDEWHGQGTRCNRSASALRSGSCDEDRDRRNRHLRAGGRPPAAPRARDHRLRGGATRLGGHTNTVRGRRPRDGDALRSTPASSSSTTATTPTSKPCWRSSASPASPPTWASRSPTASGRFEYSGTPRGLFARPAHLLSPTFLGMLRDWRRFNREARALIGMNGTAPSLGALARAEGLLPALRRAADRPPGLRRLVGGPGADVELPGQLHGRVLREPRHVQPARPARAGGPSRGGSRQLRRGDLGAVARPGAAAGAGAADRAAAATGCGSRPTAARARTSTRS